MAIGFVATSVTESSTKKLKTQKMKVIDWETNLRPFQDQRYRRYSSGHLRPPENEVQDRHRSGTRPSSRWRKQPDEEQL